MVNMLAFNFAFADNADVNSEAGNVETVNTEETQTDNESSVPFEAEGTANIDTEKIEEEIDTIAQQGESLIYTVIEKVSDIIQSSTVRGRKYGCKEIANSNRKC